MIAELSAALSALKETAGLVKVINDAKNDADIKAATFELNNKLLSLQSECFALGDSIRSREDEISFLKAKIAEFDEFKIQAEGFELEKLDSGAFVYSKKIQLGSDGDVIFACPQCYNQRVISILQPSSHTFYHAALEIHFSQIECNRCKSIFGKEKMTIRDLDYSSNSSWE